jgi:hypothetical protein
MALNIVCEVCGLVATRVQIGEKPLLEIPAIDFDERCVEPMPAAPDPFRCTHLQASAIRSGMIDKDGVWK